MSTRQSPWFWLAVVSLGALAGLIYNRLFGQGPPPPALIYGASVSLVVTAFERGLILQAVNERIRRLPTLLFVPLAEIAYGVMIAIGNALGGLLVWATGLTSEPLIEAVWLTPRVLLFSLAASAILVFVFRVRDLIGGEAFLSLLTSRYRRPVREERIFLFVDLAGSTAYAARHGDLEAQAYLSEIFSAIAEPVQRHRGSIDDYIGDMALITWPFARGAHEARCVSCVFAIFETIEGQADAWTARFGEVPRLRAALHGGAVVTAEVGVDRHKIAYFGDVVNTTSRLEALCRTLHVPVLISGELLARLPALPAGIRSRALGEHAVKGRDRPIGVATLERVDALAPDERPLALAAGRR